MGSSTFFLQAYKIICQVPYNLDPNNPQSEAIENDINMLVRKQLMSSKRLKKSKGVMGAIMLLGADIISDGKTKEEDSSDFESKLTEIIQNLRLKQ